MKLNRKLVPLALILIACNAPSVAEQNCEPVPTAFSAWAGPTQIASSAMPEDTPSIAIGTAYQLKLLPAAEITYAALPEKPASPGRFGGMAALNITAETHVKIALSGPAWLDVVQDGKAIKSTSHGHGPACSGIRKIVHFTLKPGRYMVQISNAPETTIRAMVIAY